MCATTPCLYESRVPHTRALGVSLYDARVRTGEGWKSQNFAHFHYVKVGQRGGVKAYETLLYVIYMRFSLRRRDQTHKSSCLSRFTRALLAATGIANELLVLFPTDRPTQWPHFLNILQEQIATNRVRFRFLILKLADPTKRCKSKQSPVT